MEFTVEFNVSDLPHPPAVFDPLRADGRPPRFTTLIPRDQVEKNLPTGITLQDLPVSSIPGFISAGSNRRPPVRYPEKTVPMEVINALLWLDAQNQTRNAFLYDKRLRVSIRVISTGRLPAHAFDGMRTKMPPYLLALQDVEVVV